MFGRRTLAVLLRIEALLRTIAQQEKLAMTTLADIQAEVTAERTIDEGLHCFLSVSCYTDSTA